MDALQGYQKEDLMMATQAAQSPGFAEYMLNSTQLFASDQEREQLLKSRRLTEDLGDWLRQRVFRLEQRDRGHFKALHAVGDENENYQMEGQWSEKDEMAHLAQGRRPYQFNVLTPYVNAIIGEQIAQRHSWRAVPHSQIPGVEMMAEAMTHYLAWVRQSRNNQWRQTETKVFRDGVVRNVGVCGIRRDPANPFESVLLEYHRGQEFMWDLYSPTGEPGDGRWLWRGFFQNRVELAWRYKAFASEILGLDARTVGNSGWEDLHTMIRPKVRGLANQIGYGSTWNPYANQMYGDYLFVREFYERREVPKWKVIDGNTGRTYYHDDSARANDFALRLHAFWMQEGLLEAVGLDRPRVTQALEGTMPIVDCHTFVGDQLVSTASKIQDRFPYKFFIPDNYNGTIVSYLERGKGRQRFLNRMMSMLDQIIGGMKPQIMVNKAFLSGQESDEEIRQRVVQMDNLWIVNNPNVEVSKVFSITMPPNHGPTIMAVANMLQNFIESYYGSSAVTGGDTSNASGVAQQTAIGRTRVTNMAIFENFGAFNREVAEEAVVQAAGLDPSVKMQIFQEDNTPKIMSFADAGVRPTADIRFSVYVDEQLASPSERERRMKDLMVVAGQLGPEAAQDLVPLFLKNASVDYSERKLWQEAREARMKMQQANIDREQDLKQELADHKKSIDEMKILIDAQRADQEGRSNIKMSVSQQLPPAGPAATASLYEHLGIEATPGMVAADSATQLLMNQDARDLGQQRTNDLMTPEQKKLMEAKAAQIKASLLSNHDKTNRDLKRDLG